MVAEGPQERILSERLDEFSSSLHDSQSLPGSVRERLGSPLQGSTDLWSERAFMYWDGRPRLPNFCWVQEELGGVVRLCRTRLLLRRLLRRLSAPTAERAKALSIIKERRDDGRRSPFSSCLSLLVSLFVELSSCFSSSYPSEMAFLALI